MATVIAPPRTPSPKVRIRSQSFDSPSSRISVTPLEESPFSKSTGAIVSNPFPRPRLTKGADNGTIPAISTLLPLHSKMSDESILSDTSSASSSAISSPTDSEINMELCADSPSASPSAQRQHPHPITFAPSIDYPSDPSTTETLPPSSPFLYQDPSYPMYSPWLVRVVLDMHDVRGLDWMSIAEPIERVWGVRASSADVLGILSGNGRVGVRWWD